MNAKSSPYSFNVYSVFTHTGGWWHLSYSKSLGKKSNFLKVPRFICFLHFSFRWISYDQENRLKYLPEIIKNLRLGLTRPQYLMDMVRKNEILKDSADVLQAVDRAKNFQLLPSRRHDYSSEHTSHRKNSRMEDVLVVLSGGETPKPPYIRSKDVYAYSFNSRQWYHLSPLPHDPGIEFASCVHDNDIFITGGGLMQTCFLRYFFRHCPCMCVCARF